DTRNDLAGVDARWGVVLGHGRLACRGECCLPAIIADTAPTVKRRPEKPLSTIVLLPTRRGQSRPRAQHRAEPCPARRRSHFHGPIQSGGSREGRSPCRRGGAQGHPGDDRDCQQDEEENHDTAVTHLLFSASTSVAPRWNAKVIATAGIHRQSKPR